VCAQGDDGSSPLAEYAQRMGGKPIEVSPGTGIRQGILPK
jgi:hypothetical protein